MTDRQVIIMRAPKWIYLRDLLYELVSRDMKVRYKRSVLGFAWSLLNPLSQLLVFSFVFHYVLPLNIPNYPAFLFCGLLAWSWFQSSLFSGSSVVIDHRDLVRRPGFPVIILPLVAVSTQFLHFLLALPILVLFVFLSGIPPQASVLFLFFILPIQFILTLALAYFLSALHVFFRDTQYLLGIALLLGFYVSPVFYASEAIPERFAAWYHLNPMTVLIDAYRSVMLAGAAPDWLPLAAILAISLVLLAAGLRLFRKASLNFIQEL